MMFHKVSCRRDVAALAPLGEPMVPLTQGGIGLPCGIHLLAASPKPRIPSFPSPVWQTHPPLLSQAPELSYPYSSALLPRNSFIVVIDDSATVRKILEVCLHREHFEVKSFEDGVQAIRWLNEPQSRVPDLVILDIGLPQMDGYEVACRLKAKPRLANTVIVMLSRRDGIIDRLKGRLAGARDYLTKPFRYQDIVAIIRSQLGLPQSTEQEHPAQLGGQDM